jgi:hypothetical protein
MSWNFRYAKEKESGGEKTAAHMENVRGGPCTGDNGCDTCMDIDEIIGSLKTTKGEKINPRNEKSINDLTRVKKMHQDLRGK